MKEKIFLILLVIICVYSESYADSCETVKDSFSRLSYGNTNGSQNWTSFWKEEGESDGASSGKARVRNDLCSSGYCLRLGTPFRGSPETYTNRGVTRQVDLSGSSSATLKFNYYKGVSTGRSSVTLAVSNNGGNSWTALKSYAISSTNYRATRQSFDITRYISGNTQIRFLGSGSRSSVSGMYIDDIAIEYCKPVVASANARLIASYDFDDDWITNNSLTDQTGTYHGSPSGSISRVLAGARGSKGDTCYAGSFSGGDVDVTGLPVSTSSGAKTSVSFWMYWDGTNSVMPMGWYYHDLWFYGGYFGFNTWSSDITGISSSGLSLGWHHVAAVFTNGNVSNNKIYIDGVQQSVTLRTSRVNNRNATVQSALSIGGVTNSTGYRFKGKLDNFKIYTGEISQSQVTADMNESNSCPSLNATLVASYNFDDDWVTNSSLTDLIGSYDGIPSGAVSQVSADASGSKGDTCYAGSFNGGAIDITGLPVSTTTGDKTSVSFWMKWGGTNSVMPMGWYQHDLWLVSGYFGYNTWNSDLTGIYSSGLSSGWHHVAAVFTNGSVSNNILYIDGDLQTISSFGNSINAANAIVKSALRMGGVTYTTGYRFRGLLDNFKVYNGTITQSQVSGDMNESNVCPSTDTPATAFNCVENGSNGITGKIYTKTTAQSFSLDVVALLDSSAIETSFSSGADHNVSVELVDSNSGGSCSAYSALTPAVSQSLLFTSSDTGTKASAAMSSDSAYSSVKCRVTDATDSPTVVVGCSTDSFSIRPTEFTLTSNLTYTGSSTLPRTKTGENFTLTANTNSGYTGIPKIDTTNNKIQAHLGAIQVGTLTGSFNAAISGVANGTTFTYSEVGALRFAAEGIYDDTFTAVDPATECTNDFSNTVVSAKVGCKFGNTTTSNYVGRFTPDHFELSETSLENRNNLSCLPASSFTYTGESFETTFKLTAKNSGNVTTQNYRGDFAKLDATVISNFNFGVIDLADAIKPVSATELNSSLSLVSSSGTWINGEAAITASLGLARTTTNGPFESFNVGIAPVDSDGIIFSSYDLDTSVPADSNDRNLLGTTKIRFGRLNIDNAHGSELLSLPVNLYTEYFNGTSFVINTTDNCTPISVSQLNFNGGTNPITVGSGSSNASIANVRLLSGKADFSLTAPGTNITGFIDITSQIFISSFPWLNYDWDSNGSYDNSPSARASFGLYKGNSKQIYLREVY